MCPTAVTTCPRRVQARKWGYLIDEDDPLDEAQFAAWVKQASKELPDERM
jgi:hypothetical protein